MARNVSNTESGKRAPAPFRACRVRGQQGGGEASWRRQARVEECGTRRCRRKAGQGLPPPPGPSCCEPPSAHLAACLARPRRPAGRGPEASAAPRTAPPGAQPPTPATPLRGGRSSRAALLRDRSAAPGEGKAGGCDGDAQSRPRCSRQRPGSPGLPIGQVDTTSQPRGAASGWAATLYACASLDGLLPVGPPKCLSHQRALTGAAEAKPAWRPWAKATTSQDPATQHARPIRAHPAPRQERHAGNVWDTSGVTGSLA